MKFRTHRRRCRAFTLLELLVATTITLLIAGLMLAVATQLLDIWQRQQGAHAQAMSAKQALDELERDVQAALRRNDSSVGLAVDVLDTSAALAHHGWLLSGARHKPAQGGSLRLGPMAEGAGRRRLSDARFGLSGTWLRFVTTNVESGGSLPVVVAYQVARRPITGDAVASNPAPVRYALYRSAISPTETFLGGYEVTAAVYGSADNAPSSALGGAFRSPRNVMNPSHANLLAANVVDFGCWLFVRESDGALRQIYPENENDLSHHAAGNSQTDATRFPDVIDVMVRVISEKGARLLDGIETGRIASRPPEYADDAAWWWGVVEVHSAVFTRRLEIKGGGR